ncbi:hypothetical protein [Mycolicibacterium vaccae]|nr:hypothetical protein [Mycolicibacterium vaccae]
MGARVVAATVMVLSGLLVGAVPTASAESGPRAVDGVVGGADGDAARPDLPKGEPDSVDSGDPVEDPASDPPEDPPEEPADPVDPPDPADTVPPPASGPRGEDDAVEPRPCCEDADPDCAPGWPWPGQPGEVPRSEGVYGDRPPEGMPSIRPIPGGVVGPGAELPAGEPPGVLDAVPGIGAADGDVPEAPITVPIVVTVPGVGTAAPVGAGQGAGTSGGAVRLAETPPPARSATTPATGETAVPASAARVGYGEYLRAAGLSQIAALALPGLAGLLALTGAGGLVGYRQAKAGQGVRTGGTARFMN